MSIALIDLDAWVTAALLAMAMLAAWAAAWWRGQSLSRQGREAPASKFNDAILALLGLLLAFTFSMSLVKHEQRRQMAVADSNAIGDFYTTASLLKEPLRGQLQVVVRRYLEHRLSLGQSTDETVLERNLDEIRELHGQMQSLVAQAVDGGTPVVVPLVNTLNALTSSHAARLAAVRDRLPSSIVLLLFLAALLSTAQTGRQQGAAKEWRPGPTVGFTLLVCMVVWATLDLNQPRRGWITVSQQPLLELLESMKN